MIKIAVDSSSDYTYEDIQEKKLCLIPITITLGNDNYVEGVNLNRNDFYRLLEKSSKFPHTSQPSPQAFLELFQNAKDNRDSVICILLSSSLSGTCQSAHLAKNMVDYENIYIIDSLSATFTIKIMADYACRLVSEGLSAAKITEKIEALKPRVKVIAALDTLEYLYKGGRLSRASAAIGTMANVKPIITLTEEGGIGVLSKALGRGKAAASILNHLKELGRDESFPLYPIYSYGTENCEKLEKKLLENGFSPEGRMQIGPTIGTHIGPGAFGIVFVAKSPLQATEDQARDAALQQGI